MYDFIAEGTQHIAIDGITIGRNQAYDRANDIIIAVGPNQAYNKANDYSKIVGPNEGYNKAGKHIIMTHYKYHTLLCVIITDELKN